MFLLQLNSVLFYSLLLLKLMNTKFHGLIRQLSREMPEIRLRDSHITLLLPCRVSVLKALLNKNS